MPSEPVIPHTLSSVTPPTPLSNSGGGGELRIKYASLISLIIIAALAIGGVEGVKWAYSKITATPTLELPVEVKGLPGTIIPIVAQGTASDIRWHSSDKLLSIADRTLLNGPNTILVASSVPGTYTISAHGSLHNRSTEVVSTRVVISGDVPPPIPPGPGPVPPGPIPIPVPPTPPAPIPEPGLHVLMLYDDAKKSSLSAEQQAILGGQEVRDYLNSKAAGNWRIWRTTVDPTNESKVWQDAFAKAKDKQQPWVVISNGKTGYEGPLPSSVSDMITKLKLYGE